MSEGLRVFESMWERLRNPNEELRPRLAAWLREVVPPTDTIRVGRGPVVPLNAWANALYRDNGWQIQLNFDRGPSHTFAIAPVVPVEPTQAEWDLLGLEDRYRSFIPMAWLLELFGEAWVEAGLAARGVPLSIFGSGEYRGPGGRMKWKAMLRGLAYRATAPMPASLKLRSTEQDDLVDPPHPQTLPETPPALQEACRNGEPDALLVWADALDTAGDQASGELLRWVHTFADRLAPGIKKWARHGAFWVFTQAERSWWGQGEDGSEADDNSIDSNRLAQLLRGWNVYYPAIEWLLRRTGLLNVKVRLAYFANGSKSRYLKFPLKAGQHLEKIDEYSGVIELWADTSAKVK